MAGYLFGFGVKKRAAQTDIWKELRGQANLGLCDSEFLQKHLDTAIRDCNTALTYMPNDLFTNFRLGVIYSAKFNEHNEVGLLAAAKNHFDAAIAANPDAQEAENARKIVKRIDTALAQVH